jgi:hypothetical protein
VIGQQVFDGVSEALNADAKLVPGRRTVGALRAGVKVAGFVDALDGEALRGEARRRDEANAASELLFEARPGFDVEFFDGAKGAVAEVGLVFGEVSVELGTQDVPIGSELLDPIVHDLRIAQDTETTEELAGDAAHFGPSGIGVDFLKNGADGAAAANGDAEIVNRVGRGVFADGFQLFEDALHGFAEIALGHGRKRNGDDG